MAEKTSYSCLHQLVHEQAECNPDAVAILAPGRRPLTYGKLRRQMVRVVETLNCSRIGRNDRVAMALPDGPELAVAFIAISAGAACAPLDPSHRAAEFDHHLADLNAKALVALAGSTSPAIDVARNRGIAVLDLAPVAGGEAGLFTLHPHVEGGAEPVILAQPDDVALALHTSGTAARPKLVPLTHRNICASAYNIQSAVELSANDRCLNVMPLFHIHGLSTIFASLAAGASVICTAGFSASQFFEWLAALRPTWYTAAPVIHQAILEHALRYPESTASVSLRFVRSASAAMPRRVMEELERVFRAPFIEAYGMTEAAPQIASNRLPPAVRKPGSVGQAAGPDVAIMSESGELRAAAEIGEIVIRGSNVVAGYQGWLRTGDLGYLDRDGFLFITGRLKEIINRGGEKISPREVDEILMEHPAVAQAATFAMPHPALGEDVAAAVILRENATATEAAIRQFVSERLVWFKVPQQIVFVKEIPKGLTGKLERIRLAERLGLVHKPVDSTAPRTAVEDKLARIWASVLGIARPGVHANFFHLGGTSLTATQVLARVIHEFGVELPADEVFNRPTVAGFAELLSNPGSLVSVPDEQRAGPVPLSFSQERLWFIDQIEPGNPAYNINASLWLTGKLDEGAIERSLNEIRRRHQILRTTFGISGEQPAQLIAPAAPTELPLVDLTELPAADRERETLRLASEEADGRFDLKRGPLFRATLLRMAPEEHALLVTMHHSISDGWSIGVLYRELRELYTAFVAGLPSPLAEPAIQYADFAAWQRKHLTGELLESRLSYWRGVLGNAPTTIDLPVDHPRPTVQTYRGARMPMAIPRRVTDQLKELGLRENATLFMTVMAAFQVLLLRYTGQDDFLVGIPVANRLRLETEVLIGFFANTLALRADLSGDPTFRELLSRVRMAARGAYTHQDVPFEKLVRELQPLRDPSRMPLFQVMFAFQNVPEGGFSDFELAPGVSARPFKADPAGAKFDLTLYVWEAGQELAGAWLYNVDLFDAATIEQMAGQFSDLLEAVPAAPEKQISEFPLFGRTVRKSAEAPHRPDCCFHDLFQAQVERTPDAVAVECGHERLTYSELNGRANQLARRLHGLGVRPETLVGICLPRCVEMLVAVLGVMKAGGAYVPLDPEYPPEQLAFMLEDSKLRALVTEQRSLAKLDHGTGVPVVCPEAEGELIGVENAQNTNSNTTPGDLAYVMYTSGSMGRPKGVMVTHANVVHCAQAMREATGIVADDRYLHTASFAFSSSVRQMVVPLSCGACVVLARIEEIRDPGTLFDVIFRHRVSVIDVVPSYWRSCIQALRNLEPSSRTELLRNELRLILSASERLWPDLPSDWALRLGHNAQMINMYGQTETTGIVTTYAIPPAGGNPRTGIPIGKPIPNTVVYVLDASGRPAPIGLSGEVYIGGAGVARGYLNQPELTAERFVPERFGVDGRPLYRTGDLARIRPDGDIEFIGRTDNQIKMRGFRIEPGEIEGALRRHATVRESAVVAAGDRGDQRIVAFVTVREGLAHESLTSELRRFLQRNLPEHMVPTAIVVLEALPLTQNGKLDRKALLELDRWPTASARFVAPRTPVEQKLAAVWQQVLHVERISVEDNFFDLGGDSLLSVQMISRANQAGLQLTLKQFFEHQTIAELARLTNRAPKRETVDGAKDEIIRVTVESLRAYGREALERAGLSAEGAAVVTEVQLAASLRGQQTHNMDSIPRYARHLLSGVLNPRPQIRIEREAAISAQIDGDNAPGQWVAVVAIEAAIRKARERGLAVVAVRRSNHFGAAGHYVWLAAREGLIGLCTTNGPVILAPTGGITPTFGNNPLGVGVPAGRHYPILLDIAMSVAPRGKIGLQLAEGNALPSGWILDRFGLPSTNPADLAAGLGVPIGGHKGYGLALVMELLAGALTGAGFCLDHTRERMKSTEPRDIGHFFMVIDPALFSPFEEFTARVDRMIDQTKGGQRAESVEEILIPGESELRAREQNLRAGVPLRPVTYHALLKYGETAGLNGRLVTV